MPRVKAYLSRERLVNLWRLSGNSDEKRVLSAERDTFRLVAEVLKADLGDPTGEAEGSVPFVDSEGRFLTAFADDDPDLAWDGLRRRM